MQWLLIHATLNPFPLPVRIDLYDLLKFMDIITQMLAQSPIEVDLRFGRQFLNDLIQFSVAGCDYLLPVAFVGFANALKFLELIKDGGICFEAGVERNKSPEKLGKYLSIFPPGST